MSPKPERQPDDRPGGEGRRVWFDVNTFGSARELALTRHASTRAVIRRSRNLGSAPTAMANGLMFILKALGPFCRLEGAMASWCSFTLVAVLTVVAVSTAGCGNPTSPSVATSAASSVDDVLARAESLSG